MQKLRIIVPSYNEGKCVFPFYEGVMPYLNNPEYEYEILYVDDGSKDDTLEQIKELRKKDDRVKYISFSRNFGKEAAMLAGLKASLDVDAVVIIDADLQHPPYLIQEMIQKREEGYKIIFAKRRSRKGDNFVKKVSAHSFYSFFNRYSDTQMEQSSTDYMLMDKSVVKAFVDMPDEYRFTKGITAYVGFKKCFVEFDYVARENGKSKWTLKKLFKYGINGLGQFSDVFLFVPKLVAFLSFLVSIASIFLFVFNVIDLSSFLIMLLIPLLFMLTNITLYTVLYVLYSNKKETMKRPLYFVEESSFDEEAL